MDQFPPTFLLAMYFQIIPLSSQCFHVQLEKQHLISHLFKGSLTPKMLIPIQMLIEELKDECGLGFFWLVGFGLFCFVLLVIFCFVFFFTGIFLLEK